MTPFQRTPRSAITAMFERNALMSQPAEFFQPFFGGRTPTLREKLQCIEESLQLMSSAYIFDNNLYHVEITYLPPMARLSIRRHDGRRCNEWRHLQQIKNELVGPACEGVQLFPAEERLVDTSNEYHLWVHADPGYRFPFGFIRRFVLDAPVMAMQMPTRPISTDRVAHAVSA